MPAPYVIPATITADGTGPTRAEYRRAIAEELGEFGLFTVSATPSSAVHPDADRQVLVTALGSDGLDTGRFDGGYVYVVDGVEAGEVRAILPGTFDGAIRSLLLDRPFSPPLASGTAIELTKPLPGSRHLTLIGLNQLVDEALARLTTVVLLPLTGTDSRDVALSAYPWLTDDDQIIGVYDTSMYGTAQPSELSAYHPRMVANGVSRSIITGPTYSTTDTYSVAAIGPADRLIYDGTSWDYAAVPGLQNDRYQAAVPVGQVLAFGMVKALQHVRRMTMRRRDIDVQERRAELAEIETRLRTWALAAAQIKLYDLPKPMQRRTAGPIANTGYSSWDFREAR